MAMPTITVRARPEHHELIRAVAAALKADPAAADVLRTVLQRDTQPAPDRLDAAERRLDRVESDLAIVSHRLAQFERAAAARSTSVTDVTQVPEAVVTRDVIQDVAQTPEPEAHAAELARAGATRAEIVRRTGLSDWRARQVVRAVRAETGQ